MKIFLNLVFILTVQIASGQLDIFDVARKGTLEQLSNLININQDTVNSINQRGDSPLVLACYYGNNEVAKKLIDIVKDINIESKEGTPLTATIFTKNFELSSYLIKHGANIEQTNKSGQTPLLLALINNDIKAAKLLIEFDANTTIKDKNNMAAIDYAKAINNEDLIKLIRN